MGLCTTVRGERFSFADLREVLAKANEPKSGDGLAGIAAASERERVAANLVLADVRLSDFTEQPLIDPDTDEVAALLLAEAMRRKSRSGVAIKEGPPGDAG